jgi:glutamate--cysteine ligase
MLHDVPRMGLDTPHRSRTVRDIALEVLDIAREGLHRRSRRDLAGEDETHFLDPLFSIAGSGRTPAAELVEDYRTRWNGDITRIYTEQAY